MKRRKFIQWVLSLPLVSKLISGLSASPHRLEASHTVTDADVPIHDRYHSHAENIGKVFADIFWLAVERGVDSKVVDHPSHEFEWKSISYLAEDNLQAKVGTVDTVIEKLAIAVKDDLLVKQSKKVTFFRLPLLPSRYGTPQYRPEFYDTCLRVSVERDCHGLTITLDMMYEVQC